MSRRALRAGLCALAAVAFLLAAFLPWFESRRGGGDDDPESPRASYQLQGGEACARGRCRDVGYTGAPGTRDDVVAGLGWTTLADALTAVTLLLAVAAARRRHRPLRAWAATSAASAAGLGALFVACETISRRDDIERGWGLAAITVGAVIAGVALALPAAEGPPDRRAWRRYGPALAIAGGAMLAWLTLTDHGWWRGVGAFRAIAASPLGREVCDGNDCQSDALALGGSGFLLLARLTAALIAALLVPALGAAARAAAARAPGAWGVAAMVLALAALATGTGAAVLHPSGGPDGVAWGLPACGAALAAVTLGALVARRWVTSVEDVAVVAAPPRPSTPLSRALGPRPAPGAAGAPALAPRPPGAPRPVLPALGAAAAAAPASAGPPSPAGPVPTSSLAATNPWLGALPVGGAAPAPTGPIDPMAGPGRSPFAPPVAAAVAPRSPYAPPVATDGPAGAMAVAPRSPYAPPASPYAPPVAPSAPASPYAPPASPSAPASPYARPGFNPAGATSPYAPPAAIAAPRDAFVPPRPGAAAPPVRGQVVAPAPMARRASPSCPQCRQATLWHGKRGAWWCSACKRTL